MPLSFDLGPGALGIIKSEVSRERERERRIQRWKLNKGIIMPRDEFTTIVITE